MHYLEERPIGRPSAYVKLYWEMAHGRDEIIAGPEPVLPDGCVEIIFDLKDRFLTYRSDNTTVNQPRSIVAGQLTSRIMIGPSGDTEMFGIRLRPEAAFPLLGVAMHELCDRLVDFADIDHGIETQMFERIAAANSFTERIAIFEEIFIDSGSGGIDREMSECISMMIGSDGRMPVSFCAEKLGWSERRLERSFREQIGMRPKLYSRIIRFKSFLAAVESGTPLLLDQALVAGYHDQSHMIRDFKSFTAMTPTEYFGRELTFGDLFSGLMA